MRRRARWELTHIDDYRGIVFITDLNLGQVSVTNDAENVVRRLYDELSYNVNDKKVAHYRYFYRDSDGCWDELLHTCGNFTGFHSGGGIHP